MNAPKPFKLLTEAEFRNLTPDERVKYIARAIETVAEELEAKRQAQPPENQNPKES